MQAEDALFFNAIKRGDQLAVEAFLSENPRLAGARDPGGMSAVLTALYYQQEAIAQFLINREAPLNLFEASAAGAMDVVREILDAAPAQVNSWSADGFQPLGLACFFGREPLAAFLLERGADAGASSRNLLNVQPLHSAVAGRNPGITRLLLDHGADPNARQGEGFTPLHAAAQNGDMETIRLLLERGADSSARSSAGQSPAQIAAEAGQDQAARLIDHWGV
jgi:ankyrin repeat protein